MSSRESLHIEFPMDADFIPSVRKFVAEASLIEGFTPKFSYRTEIIVDELCNNAVKYGPSTGGAHIKIQADFDDDVLQLTVQDPGGNPRDIQNLHTLIQDNQDRQRFLGHGLEIVRMLTSGLEVSQTSNGETVVRVVKRRSQNLIDSLTE
jgi:anti-sigma regulatory factor (Ser/Thr protein kinase)